MGHQLWAQVMLVQDVLSQSLLGPQLQGQVTMLLWHTAPLVTPQLQAQAVLVQPGVSQPLLGPQLQGQVTMLL